MKKVFVKENILQKSSEKKLKYAGCINPRILQSMVLCTYRAACLCGVGLKHAYATKLCLNVFYQNNLPFKIPSHL